MNIFCENCAMLCNCTSQCKTLCFAIVLLQDGSSQFDRRVVTEPLGTICVSIACNQTLFRLVRTRVLADSSFVNNPGKLIHMK